MSRDFFQQIEILNGTLNGALFLSANQGLISLVSRHRHSVKVLIWTTLFRVLVRELIKESGIERDEECTIYLRSGM